MPEVEVDLYEDLAAGHRLDIIDEITAHARAAYQLHPAVDTIIEIGGQDCKIHHPERWSSHLLDDEQCLCGRYRVLYRGSGGKAQLSG